MKINLRTDTRLEARGSYSKSPFMHREQLKVWQRSTRLSIALYRGLSNLKDWGFRCQITRSGLPIPSNISEGCERDSAPEIIRFLKIAK